MSLQLICAAAKLLEHRWRLMKAGSTTPEIAAICLSLWSCSNTGVWSLLVHKEGWIETSEGQKLKSPELQVSTEESVAI